MTERKTLSLKTKPKPTAQPEKIPSPAAEVTVTATIEKIEAQPTTSNAPVEFISIAELAAIYPKAFFTIGKLRKPLMVGIRDKRVQLTKRHQSPTRF